MKFLIACDHLGQDGTGRFLTYLANELTKDDKFDVSLMLFHREDNLFNKYLLPEVAIINLDLKIRMRWAPFLIYKAIVSCKPDVCLFGYTQLLVLGYFAPLLRRHGIKVLFRETIIPSIYHKSDNIFFKYLFKHAYRRFDYIIAQSNDMREDLQCNWECKSDKVVKMNNPVDVAEIQRRSEGERPEDFDDFSEPIFIAAGRLDYQKGYDILIDRIAGMDKPPQFKVLILGRGPLKESLLEKIERCNLQNTIKLLGFRKNVAQYVKYSAGLILSSRYEGFPNILLEALALGKPVFSNRCPGGINEIMEDGLNGVTCDMNNQSDFNDAIKKFLHTRYDSRVIIENTYARYNLNLIMSKYKNFLLNIQ